MENQFPNGFDLLATVIKTGPGKPWSHPPKSPTKEDK